MSDESADLAGATDRELERCLFSERTRLLLRAKFDTRRANALTAEISRRADWILASKNESVKGSNSMTDSNDWQNLEQVLIAARALTEPSEPNAEYIRGQVNLIQDTSGLGLGGESAYDLLTAIISRETALSAGIAALADLVRNGDE